tara:strand:+ start:31 stop:2814 length:2784 start_codon:yes stop_codon:yes gene_type:complete
MSRARDRASREGTSPVKIGTTQLNTDSGDLKVTDTSNNLKKVVADEIHIGDSSNKVIIKKGSDNKVQFQTQASGASAADSNAGGGTTVFANIAAMTATSPNAGDQALVTANSGLYIFNGGGWYKVATVNTSPSLVSPASGTDVTLSSEGTATTIELVGTDADEGTTLQYSYAVTAGSLTNGGGTTATVTSSATSGGTYSALAASTNTTNRFIKITPSTNASYAGNFSLNFSISDGTNAATTLQNFGLAFAVSGSLYLDGTGDYVTPTPHADFNLGTGDFTIETWVWPIAVGGGVFHISGTAGGFTTSTTNTLGLGISSGTNKWKLYAGGSTADLGGSLHTPAMNAWYHIAVVRASGTTKMYVNGVEAESRSDTTNYNFNNLVIGGYYSTSYTWNGYLSNFRIVKGTAVYTGNFSVPTSPFSAGVTNTKLLVAKNSVPTAVTAGSYLFNANAENLLVTHADMSMGSGSWTIDFWFYFLVTPSSNNWFFGAGTANSDALQIYYNASSNTLNYWDVGGVGSGGCTLTNFGSETGQWHHVRFCRHGNNHYTFINGNCTDTSGNIITTGQSWTRSYTHAPSTSQLRIAGEMSGNYGWDNGILISDFRVIKGTSLQTSAAKFAVPTTPATAVSGTVLLTCQNSTGNPTVDNSGTSKTIAISQGSPTVDTRKVELATIDESSSAHGLTLNGNTAFNYATPFENAGGGSIYLSGNSNNVLKAQNADFTLGTGDWTIEGWVYYLGGGSNNNGFWQVGGNHSLGFGANYTTSVSLGLAGATTLKLYGAGGEYAFGVANAAVADTWVHYAMTKTSSNIYVYKDGTQIYTRSDTTNYSTGDYLGLGAMYGPDQTPNFYLSNFRVIKGTAVYTGNFAAPTGNLTPTGGTYSSTTNVNTSIPSGQCSVLTAITSNSFADLSGNNHTITGVGDPIATKFLPY